MPPQPPGLGSALADPTIAAWKVDDVVAYANRLELGHMEALIRSEGIDGQVLLQSSEQDLVASGFTNLQARKLLSRLPQWR